MLKHGFEGLIPNSPDTNNPLTRRIGQGDETSSCDSPFLPHPRRQVTADDSDERMKPQGFRAGGRLQIQRGGFQAFGLDGESGGAFNAGEGADYHGEFA